MTTKVLATGKTHVTPGKDGAAKSADGWLDVRMADPHPAAEDLFGAAWSACFLGALQLAASQAKVTLPATPSIDAAVPGVARDVAQRLVETAHEICPYSKATRGNIDVAVNLV